VLVGEERRAERAALGSGRAEREGEKREKKKKENGKKKRKRRGEK